MTTPRGRWWMAAVVIAAAAGLLSRSEAGVGAGVSWTGTSELNSRQGSDGSEDISDTSEQTSSDGQELHDSQTLHRGADGSTHETQDLDWLNGKGDRMENHTTWDGDKDGNRSRHIEDSYTDPEGNKTTITTDETFDRAGNRTGWKGNSKREKVQPPKRAEPKKEPEKPEEPEEPKPPKPRGTGNKPKPGAPPAEGVQVTFSLHASPTCQPGVEAVNVTANGVLALDVTPVGFTIMGDLTIQELNTSNFSCSRSYYEYATKRMVGGECQVEIQKQNPSIFLGLTAIEPLGLGVQMPEGLQNQQDLRGTVRAGRSLIFDVIRGGRYDAHTATLQLLFGNSPGLMEMTPLASLTRGDLSDGFQKTFAFQGRNFVTVADSGSDQSRPFSGTCACGELKTTGQFTLKYKGGGRGPAAQPPPSRESEEGEEILGMVVVNEPRNRPGGISGVLVTAVKRRQYSIGPGGPASGDLIVGANQKPVTCVDDLKKIVSQEGGKPVELSIVRSGKPMTFSVGP